MPSLTTKERLEQRAKALDLITEHRAECTAHGFDCTFAAALELKILAAAMVDQEAAELAMELEEKLSKVVKAMTDPDTVRCECGADVPPEIGNCTVCGRHLVKG